jgi:hypothetical protein
MAQHTPSGQHRLLRSQSALVVQTCLQAPSTTTSPPGQVIGLSLQAIVRTVASRTRWMLMYGGVYLKVALWPRTGRSVLDQ